VIKHVLVFFISAAVLSAAAATAVVAGAFALYALLSPGLGDPGAAAVVAGCAALLVAAIGIWLNLRNRAGREPAREPTVVDRLTDFARERPVIAAAGALAAGLIALKNPKLAAGLASAFMAGKAADKAERSRRR
jgi:hypothetical protein